MLEWQVIDSVDEETLAGDGCASNAVSAGNKYAPSGNHSPMETAVHATDCTLLGHGWRCNSDCCSKHGRGKAAEMISGANGLEVSSRTVHIKWRSPWLPHL